MLRIRAIDLLGSAAVAIALLVGVNVTIALAARRLPPQQLLQRIDATAAQARVVFLGDSQMEADADPVAFSAGCARPKDYPPSINVGLGATRAAEHCLVLEYLLDRAPAAKAVFYGFYDDLPTAPVPARFAELGGNRALLFQFPRRAGELMFPDDKLRRGWLRSIAAVPMISERVGIWARVERLRRRLAAIGLPMQAETRFGRVADFAALEPADPAAFEARIGATVREQRSFNFPTREIMRVAQERKVKFTLVAMPVVAEHRSRYYTSPAWLAYREYVAAVVQGNGGQYIDASDWVADNHFEDALHATPTGARLFSTRLAQQICEQHPPRPDEK